ncbi:hypothetical protein [Pseudomonas sp. MUP55]|uniref:hypothetical protein n=1 Tax=Pseudomonas sp. MUP55 TaxID=3087234 RepID=UPI002A59AE54|nr:MULTISPECIES: hypothetical protein [unclassified Pseudomonas]WPN90304.1 hypothetical protein SC319_13570 [Pseudomonas sp. MUP56]WPN95829.1 hypothetical protein SC318_13575 [Pseudomonas sp. MUP55]
MKPANKDRVPQINKIRARLIRFARVLKKWVPKSDAFIWALLVLAMFRSKMVGSKFYNQSCGSKSNTSKDLLEDMAYLIGDSKCAALSDVCDTWELSYDKVINR